MYAGYIDGNPLDCAEVHDIALTNGYLGRGTILEDSGYVVYRNLMNERDGTPQIMILDRWMHIRGYKVDWDPVNDPPYWQALIETLLAE